MGDPPRLRACPVERAIQVIGGKWKLLVLRALTLQGPQRFNDLLRVIEGISAKELTRNLRDLEGAHLISRDADDAPHAAYRLSEVGASLSPVFDALRRWGEATLDLAAE